MTVFDGSAGGELVIRGPQGGEFAIALSTIERQVVVSAGSSTDVVIDDANIRQSSASTVANEFLLSAAITAGLPSVVSSLRFEAVNGVGSVSGAVASRVSSGEEIILAKTAWGAARTTVTFSQSGGQTGEEFLSYVAGSLGKAILDEATARLGQGSLPLLTLRNDTTSTYVRNAGCWINADWTGRPVFPQYFPGALISPRHLCMANHAHPSVGSTIRFLTSDNTVVSRTIANGLGIANSDIWIGVLNEDVPETIAHYSVLPADLTDYIRNYQCPAIVTDGEGNALASRWSAYNLIDPYTAAFLKVYTSGDFAPYSQQIVGGDSGSPVFILLDGNLVLLGCHYTSAGDDASFNPISGYITAINAAMTTLGGGYQLSIVDLSEYPNYGD